ncbi:hypothetical protein [Spirillospora sp. CA-128828]
MIEVVPAAAPSVVDVLGAEPVEAGVRSGGRLRKWKNRTPAVWLQR